MVRNVAFRKRQSKKCSDWKERKGEGEEREWGQGINTHVHPASLGMVCAEAYAPVRGQQALPAPSEQVCACKATL